MEIVNIRPTPTPIPEETWRRARGNQLFRARRFVETGRERERLINLGFIIPRKKK